MANKVDLSSLFEDLTTQLVPTLETIRKHISHSGEMGDCTEIEWLNILRDYLPLRYQVEKAFVVDSNGARSEQQDIVIFDRQYSPFIFKTKGSCLVPAESVYIIIEVKQKLNKAYIDYAGEKAASVRSLYRTSDSIHHAGGIYPPKKLFEIPTGILALSSEWNPPLGKKFEEAIKNNSESNCQINFGCVLTEGAFSVEYTPEGEIKIERSEKKFSLVYFLLTVFYKLQNLGTVPAIDISKYRKWLR